MVNERVIEIPWALAQLPHSGLILDVGSCEATYLDAIGYSDRQLHCMDPRNCPENVPPGAVFYHQSIIGTTLPAATYDAVIVLSVLEHVGLPCYSQKPFPRGDYLTLAEVRRLLKPDGRAIVTIPAGYSKTVSWYRQYSPADIQKLFTGWRIEVQYWGFTGDQYVPINEADVIQYDYRDQCSPIAGAGALAGIIARLR